MTAPARFKQDDVKRAVAGVAAAGIPVGRVMIDPNGNIVVEAAAPGAVTAKKNPWDTVTE
ncbi:hypothetical protein [Sphingomonas sp.]|uniref:hypothetical protein n=1 Tax=Sphingomonas sp. TaxID=28214 RepID=UPI00307D8BAA